ncbi:hypothetical protein BWD42_12920 [Sphingobacterium sp. CZ-UAM]|uniref:transglutaminase domain-containing protein n=1 Tax=Sphingobacterium sp. CZ-UAM TaxID=1933868 RepID=UPI0009877A77|nr:transglutaminase domain-containing protein [Sphingobacterium sp. CZ-UAM]OOG18163.1 hypothetical protein BWD42_12920 [Sphingobacterium sp. CZ-UAM]
MKATLLTIFFLLSLSGLISYGQQRTVPEQQLLSLSLDFAGKNKSNLQQVLDHYSKAPGDSLKLRAARFLIANMTGHFSYAGYLQKGMSDLIDHVKHLEDSLDRKMWRFYADPLVDRAWDSVINKSKAVNPSPSQVFDNKVINAQLLIENIDHAFEAWNYPWSKHLTFDEFCDYILPYRFYDEPLESWRPLYREKFSWLVQAMEKIGSTDPVDACRLINDSLRYKFTFNPAMFSYPAALGPLEVLKGGMGKCLDQAGFANYAMRAMGIPVILEQIPHWADRSMGHEFCSVRKKDGSFASFLGAELPPGKNEIRNVAPKIYRTFYRIQDDRYLVDEVSLGDVSALFDRYQLDVTKEHIPVRDIVLKLPDHSCVPGETIYICVFDNEKWIPFSSTETADGKNAVFKDIGLGAVYLPMAIKSQMLPLSAPLLLKKDGGLSEIRPTGSEVEKVVLSRKYPLGEKQRAWLELVRGGLFQGAGSADFSDAQEIIKISWSEMAMNKYYYGNNGSFRYIRYVFPDSSFGSLAELAVYADSLFQIPLKGKPVASAKVKPEDVKIAFDGRLDNFIYTEAADTYKGEWIGLDLGERTKITAVGLSPRNDTNGIMQGMNYELFYWKDKWVSLGAGTLDSQLRLNYGRVPKGALLLLRNHTEGKEERIFTYENGKQVWW